MRTRSSKSISDRISLFELIVLLLTLLFAPMKINGATQEAVNRHASAGTQLLRQMYRRESIGRWYRTMRDSMVVRYPCGLRWVAFDVYQHLSDRVPQIQHDVVTARGRERAPTVGPRSLVKGTERESSNAAAGMNVTFCTVSILPLSRKPFRTCASGCTVDCRFTRARSLCTCPWSHCPFSLDPARNAIARCRRTE